MMKESSKKFFAPPDGFDSLDSARFVVMAVPIEATVSYGGGTAEGPASLLEASQQVELFDVDEQSEPYKKGIATLEFPPAMRDAAQAVAYGYETTKELVAQGKIPVILGGEHSLSAGPVRAVAEHYGTISLLHFDAHGDFRDTYHGDKFSHASALRRCHEIPGVSMIVQAGIRNVSNDPADGSEFDYMQAHANTIKVYYAKDMKSWNIGEMIGHLSDNVYITFDVDGFDGSLMPSTGTPEPGGLDWYTTLEIIKTAAAKKRIVGMDFVEYAPMRNFHAPTFMIAKLIYKTIGYTRI